MNRTGSEWELIEPDLECVPDPAGQGSRLRWWRCGVVVPFLLTFVVFCIKGVFSETCNLPCSTGLSAFLTLSEKWQFFCSLADGKQEESVSEIDPAKGVNDWVSLTKPEQTDLFVDSKLNADCPTRQINCSLGLVMVSGPQNSPLAPFLNTFSLKKKKNSKIYIFMTLVSEVLHFPGFIKENFWRWHFCDIAN